MKKTIQLSMLLALAVALNVVENFIPIFSFLVPGLKLGLANTVIIFALIIYGFKSALYLTVLRVFLVGIFATGLFSPTFFFSLIGALLSVFAMGLTNKLTKLSIVGISIIGSIFHSIGQVLVAMVLLNSNMLYYLPWLLLFSIPTGIMIGLISKELVNSLKRYC